MANRYYLLDLGAQKAPRLGEATSRLGPLAGRRVQPHEIGHLRESPDGTRAILQGELDDLEHAWFAARPWATFLGFGLAGNRADADVRAYLAANRAAWEPARA